MSTSTDVSRGPQPPKEDGKPKAPLAAATEAPTNQPEPQPLSPTAGPQPPKEDGKPKAPWVAATETTTTRTKSEPMSPSIGPQPPKEDGKPKAPWVAATETSTTRTDCKPVTSSVGPQPPKEDGKPKAPWAAATETTTRPVSSSVGPQPPKEDGKPKAPWVAATETSTTRTESKPMTSSVGPHPPKEDGKPKAPIAAATKPTTRIETEPSDPTTRPLVSASEIPNIHPEPSPKSTSTSSIPPTDTHPIPSTETEAQSTPHGPPKSKDVTSVYTPVSPVRTYSTVNVGPTTCDTSDSTASGTQGPTSNWPPETTGPRGNYQGTPLPASSITTKGLPVDEHEVTVRSGGSTGSGGGGPSGSKRTGTPVPVNVHDPERLTIDAPAATVLTGQQYLVNLDNTTIMTTVTPIADRDVILVTARDTEAEDGGVTAMERALPDRTAYDDTRDVVSTAAEAPTAFSTPGVEGQNVQPQQRAVGTNLAAVVGGLVLLGAYKGVRKSG